MELKTAAELAVTLLYQLISMRVEVTKPARIYVDNKRVCINSTNPASKLNKKSVVVLAYHFVRYQQSGSVINIHHIKSEDNNYADMLISPLNSNALRNLVYEEFML